MKDYLMSATHSRHVLVSSYLLVLLQTYLAEQPLGIVMPAPFGMQLETHLPPYDPDLQVILKSNPGEMTPAKFIGAADICIEIVSQDTIERDYRTRRLEYEKKGVQEYWIIDPLEKACLFYCLEDNRRYFAHFRAGDDYTTPLLPRFKLHMPSLWLEPLPTPKQIVKAVELMLAEE
jgi:Uma2 family endonuclease